MLGEDMCMCMVNAARTSDNMVRPHMDQDQFRNVRTGPVLTLARTLQIMLLGGYETEYLYLSVIKIYKVDVSEMLGCKGSYNG